MNDRYPGQHNTIDGPGDDAANVTPGQSALGNTTRALYIGGTGNVAVRMKGGEDVIFEDVPAGTILPIRVTHVWDTGGSPSYTTTATKITAIW